MIKPERQSRDGGHDYKRRDSYEDTRSPISRRYSKDSDQRGGFGRKIGHHLEEELKFVDTNTSWKDSINDSAPPPGSWTSVEKMGESGLPDLNDEFRRKLPKELLTEEQKKEKLQNPPTPVKIDYSMSAVLR